MFRMLLLLVAIVGCRGHPTEANTYSGGIVDVFSEIDGIKVICFSFLAGSLAI